MSCRRMKPHCQALCPPTAYANLRPCSKWQNLRKVEYRGKLLLLCRHHQAMVEAGKRLK